MAKLSGIDRRDLLAMANSAALRKDFEVMRKNRLSLLKKEGKSNVDAYMEFLNFANVFANHAAKPFRKIKGDNFRI